MEPFQTISIRRGTGRNVRSLPVRIPSTAQLVTEALRLKAESGGKCQTSGTYGAGCIGSYLPPRKYTTTEINPFTGESGASHEGAGGEVCTFYYYDGMLTAFAVTTFDTNPPTIRLLYDRAIVDNSYLFEDDNSEIGIEGTPAIVQRAQFERDPSLRNACLKLRGGAMCYLWFRFWNGLRSYR